jgi:hypothetical protein
MWVIGIKRAKGRFWVGSGYFLSGMIGANFANESRISMKQALVFSFVLITFSCGGTQEKRKEKPEPAKTVTTEPVSPTVPADHEHESPHGGKVATSGDKHLELKLSADGHIDVFVLDGEARPASTKGVQGKVKLTLDDGIKEFPLTYDAQSDHLTAMAPPFTAKKLVAFLDLTIDGKLYSARFDYQFEADDH